MSLRVARPHKTPPAQRCAPSRRVLAIRNILDQPDRQTETSCRNQLPTVASGVGPAQMRTEMFHRIIARLVSCLLLSLVVCIGGATPSPVVQAAGSPEPAAAPGPSAAGSRVDPRQAPAPEGDTPEQLPRRYPVGPAGMG